MREFLQLLLSRGELERVNEPVSTDRDISSILLEFQDRAFEFENVADSQFKVAGNLYGTRNRICLGLGIEEREKTLSGFLQDSMENPLSERGHVSRFERSSWDYSGEADLGKLPILKHFDKEAGKYLTAGIVCAKYPGRREENLSFHRMLVLAKNKVTARIVPRHLNQIGNETSSHKVPVTIIIGPPPSVFVAASLQVEYGLSEYRIANKMSGGNLELSSSEMSDIAYPKDTEIVLEGIVDFSELVPEAPFVDLTQTYDEVRKQPVITLTKMHYRKDSVYHAVLASSSEHSIFMGLPQELKIRTALLKSVSGVRGINLTPASNGYFHCVVSIKKTNDGDGKTTIVNCFGASHPLKLVVAVDNDVDPFDLSAVEWALATRFQADRGLVIIKGARGSSLDPSSEKRAVTSKLGLDATLPLGADLSKFERAVITPGDAAKAVMESLRKYGRKPSSGMRKG